MDGRKLSREVREEIRIRAVKPVEDGECPEFVVRTLGFHRSCIYDWLARFREGGIEALRLKKIPGKKPKLDGGQLRRAHTQDPEAVRLCKEQEYPRIARQAKAVVFFADQSSVRSEYHGGTTWSPAGKTPVVASNS